MRITKIRIKNFKGLEPIGDLKSIDLHQIDCFTGPNGIGKTRILQAVELAIAGAVKDSVSGTTIDVLNFFPRNADEHSPERDEIGVVVEIEGSKIQTIARTFTRETVDGKPKVTQQITLSPGNLPQKTKEAERLIGEELGASIVMFDPFQFARMTIGERSKFLFDACLDNSSPVELKIYAQQLADRFLERNKPEPLNAFTVRLDEWLGSFPERISPGEILQHLIGKTDTILSETNKELRAIDDKIKSTYKELSLNPKASMREADKIKSELERARKDLNELSIEAAKRSVIRTEKETKDREYSATKILIGNYLTMNLIPGLTMLSREKIGEVREILERQVKESSDAILKIDAEVNSINDKLNALAPDIAVIATQIRETKENLNLMATGTCPTCGQNTTDQALGLQVKLNGYQSLLASLTKYQDQHTASRKEASEKLAKLFEIRNQGQDALLKLERLEAALGLITAIDAWRKEHAELLTSDTESEQQFQALKYSITRLTEGLEKRQRVDTLTSQTKAWEMDAGTLNDRKKLMEMIKPFLANERQHYIEAALSSVIDSVRDALYPLTSQWESTFGIASKDERGAQAISIGWYHEGRFIEFDLLSKAQQIFTMGALLPRLIARTNPGRLNLVIFDNCEVIHRARRGAFISTILDSALGLHMNVILGSTGRFPTSFDGDIVIHELGRSEEVVTSNQK